jgi:uncharacterized protein YjiS (DUF1127 family)
MSSFAVQPSNQVDSGFVVTALKALRALVHGIARRRQLRRDYLQLSAMSDPELQDMGISRSDIFNVVEGTYRSAARSLAARQEQTRRRPPTSMINRDATDRDQKRSQFVARRKEKFYEHLNPAEQQQQAKANSGGGNRPFEQQSLANAHQRACVDCVRHDRDSDI